MSVEFNREEISHIEKKLNFLVFDWAKHLIQNILSQARNNNVKKVYMNTPTSLDAGAITDNKTLYFYEKLPPLLGFQKEFANLRGQKEELWAYDLNPTISHNFIKMLKMAKQYQLEEIPKKYQGAFLGIIGKKPYYDENDVKKVINMVNKKEQKKSIPKFYYDWTSKEWSGGQKFNSNINEIVVMQKITSDMQSIIQQDPILLKFWSFLLSQNQHFGNDVIGFALISKINSNVWVINEIQTDAINAYMELRRIDKKDENENENETIDFETIKDMLEAQNKSNWIPKIESNEEFKNQIMQNPNIIQNLPDNSVNIEQWISQQQEQNQDFARGMDLIQHFQSVNFNTKIHRIY